jgi:hypothetical protein
MRAARSRGKQAAFAREHARLSSRLKPPRHRDYAEFSNPGHRDIRLAQVGESWNGSVPAYAAVATADATG